MKLIALVGKIKREIGRNGCCNTLMGGIFRRRSKAVKGEMLFSCPNGICELTGFPRQSR